ncbi:Uma2 family endonuclease [Tumidithrix elongata]
MTQAIATNNLELIQPLAHPKVLTDEQFMSLPEDGNCYEYVDGELVIAANSGVEHGYLALTLGYFLTGFVRTDKLGVTCDSSTAFKMKTGNKRSPDLAFIAKERLQGLKRLPKGFFDGAPDLAVEIISPNNTFEEIHNKLVEYFENGTRLAWVILPDEECVLVYHKPKPSKLLQLEHSLDGEDVIPNFNLPLSELFQELSF